MKVPYSWLKEYVDIDITAEELAEKLFGCGFEVEELIDLGKEVSRVVVGEVLSCEPVEGTHLQICQVNCGSYGNPIQIVTGAPNVYAGMHTPAALDNSTLPGGITIKAKPLKGIPSDGMLCSGEELGLNDDLYPGAEVYGLMDLPKDTVPGERLYFRYFCYTEPSGLPEHPGNCTGGCRNDGQGTEDARHRLHGQRLRFPRTGYYR